MLLEVWMFGQNLLARDFLGGWVGNPAAGEAQLAVPIWARDGSMRLKDWDFQAPARTRGAGEGEAEAARGEGRMATVGLECAGQTCGQRPSLAMLQEGLMQTSSLAEMNLLPLGRKPLAESRSRGVAEERRFRFPGGSGSRAVPVRAVPVWAAWPRKLPDQERRERQAEKARDESGVGSRGRRGDVLWNVPGAFWVELGL